MKFTDDSVTVTTTNVTHGQVVSDFIDFSHLRCVQEINFRKIPPVLSHVIANDQAVDVVDSYKILHGQQTER